MGISGAKNKSSFSIFRIYSIWLCSYVTRHTINLFPSRNYGLTNYFNRVGCCVGGVQMKMRSLAQIALQVAQGMKYLHGRSVVHFDLKAENLLCDLRNPDQPVVKIGTWATREMSRPPPSWCQHC